MHNTFIFLRFLVGFAMWVAFTGGVSAQAQLSPRSTALRFLQTTPEKFNLSPADVADVRVSREYLTRHNGLTHVWVQQQHHGIPVFNALFGLHVRKNGEVIHLGHTFIQNLATRTNTNLPALSAARAIEMAMIHLGFEGFAVPPLKEKINEKNLVFDAGSVSRSPIPVNICYQPLQNGSVRLAWSLTIDQINTSDYWNIRVDALTGEILDKHNYTVYCHAGGVHRHEEQCTVDQTVVQNQVEEQPLSLAGESYRVFPLPAESPAHGSRQLLTDPAIPAASPFGWLDVDGQPGAEYSYTRGNNVWAYSDAANDNIASVAESAQGTNGVFDFPYNPDAEPAANRNAAITNLFYLNNMMHDINYLFGFDEVAGNFQTNNYGKGGEDGDEVRAEALDGSGINNANFATPPDGANGRMQMFRWGRTGGELVHVSAPAEVAGSYSGRAASGWGATITTNWVSGAGELFNDGDGEGTFGCNYAINDVLGKIVLIDRGDCEFGAKARNAQLSGAIGCIICNYENVPAGMAGGNQGGNVTIPVVSLGKSDCDKLRKFAADNVLQISIGLPLQSFGPDSLTGDFDNGIIAHEYGHGISNRLVADGLGGCLSNDEQMGEGWSDFFTLVLAHRPGDTGGQPRGIGTYVEREANNGPGIRRYPYSTDMSIYPQTFADVSSAGINQETGAIVPHDVGEIWAAMLWDLYWALIEKYGYDPNLSNTQSGNFRAIQLVIDGMKFTGCEPGFVGARDGIILADIEDYQGADTCLISTVFARRGLGPNASEGSPALHTDGVTDFNPIPTCIQELKIQKQTFTPVLDPGQDAQFRITVTNHKPGPLTNVIVKDELPSGMTLNFATNGGAENNGFVEWNLGTLQSGQVVTLNYTAQTSTALGSSSFYYNPMDTPDGWLPTQIDANPLGNEFVLQNAQIKVGPLAWRVKNQNTPSDLGLEYDLSLYVETDRPVMRFWHNFNTEPSNDAGYLEFRNYDNFSWRAIPPEKVFRVPYSGKVPYETFVKPFISGFSGNSGGWVQSYIDLSDWAGQNVAFRFRFGSNGTLAPFNGAWVIDAIEMLKMYNYDGEACVASAEGDLVCAKVPQRGIFMNPAVVSTDEPEANPLGLKIQPNPATNLVLISAPETIVGRVNCQMIASDGRVIQQVDFANGIVADQLMPLDVSALSAGLYLLRFQSAAGISTLRIVVQ